MKNNHPSDLPPFNARNLRGAVFPPLKVARFSTEPEGEGMEMLLRGLLIACLVGAVAICGVRIDSATASRSSVPPSSAAQTEVAAAQPAVLPILEAL